MTSSAGEPAANGGWGRSSLLVLGPSSLAIQERAEVRRAQGSGTLNPTKLVAARSLPVAQLFPFALIDRLMLRDLRSMPMIIALTLSPSFSTLRASSTRSCAISEARR